LLSDWITSFYQDRYAVVKEERDNYKLVQDQFSGEMKSRADLLMEVAQEKQRMTDELHQAKKDKVEALLAMKRVLVRFGVSSLSYSYSLSVYPHEYHLIMTNICL
jgi:hypothetical protein